RRPVERVMPRLQYRTTLHGLLDDVEVAHRRNRDEQGGASAPQLAARRWIVGYHARPRLVHDFDTIFLDAREDQLSVGPRYQILLTEPEPGRPEFDGRLDSVDDEDRGEGGQREFGC